MKIVAMADLHGQYPDSLPEHDIVCLCGDLMASQDINRFERWLANVTHKPVLWIPGNHDVNLVDWNSGHQYVVCLRDRVVEINGIKFGGFVWNNCDNMPILEDVFVYTTADQGKLNEEVARLAECDVLLSHSPPAGVLDVTRFGHSIGVPGLLKWAMDTKCRYILCGHVHECGGKIYYKDGINIVNTAQHIVAFEIF
jgi:Icc-related predicted phosphoesterase